MKTCGKPEKSDYEVDFPESQNVNSKKLGPLGQGQ